MRQNIHVFIIVMVAFTTISSCVIPVPIPAEDNVTNTEFKIKRLTLDHAEYSEVITVIGTPDRKAPNSEGNKLISYLACKRPSGFVGVEYYTKETFDWRNEQVCFDFVLAFDGDDRIKSYTKTAYDDDYVISNDLIKRHIINSMALNGFPESQWRLYDEFGRKPEDTIWLCRSADNGYAKAQLHLGQLYWERNDISQNKIKAYVWYRLALTGDIIQGLTPDVDTQNRALVKLKHAESILSLDQLEKAKTFYADWHTGQCEQEIIQKIN